jgi:hypothetical protein
MDSEVVWKVEFVDFERVVKNLTKLSANEFTRFLKEIKIDFEVLGLRIFSTDRAKWLGNGLAEYRYRVNPTVLVRCFFCVRDEQVFLILSVYDKKRDPSAKRQAREIVLARKLMRGI